MFGEDPGRDNPAVVEHLFALGSPPLVADTGTGEVYDRVQTLEGPNQCHAAAGNYAFLDRRACGLRARPSTTPR